MDKQVIKTVMSHKTDEWQTPKKMYEAFKIRGYFDPCPIERKWNGLEIEWKLQNFVNPPYSQITKWVEKAIKENQKQKNVVLLVPSRTDTKWFRKLFDYGCNFYFITGRLKFSEKGNAPFPSVLIDLIGNQKSKMNYYNE